MNHASLELCRELFELTGGKLLSEWGSTYFYWTPNSEVAGGWYINPGGGTASSDDIPAYDLGYIMRRLPKTATIQRDSRHYASIATADYAAFLFKYKTRYHSQYADTPEDAAVKLIIELLNQGIITKEAEL